MGQEVRGGTLRTSLTLTLALAVAAASEGTDGPLLPCGTSGGSDPGDDSVEVDDRVFKFVRRAPASFRPVQRGSSSRPPVHPHTGHTAVCPVCHAFQYVPALDIGGILRGDWGHTSRKLTPSSKLVTEPPSAHSHLRSYFRADPYFDGHTYMRLTDAQMEADLGVAAGHGGTVNKKGSTYLCAWMATVATDGLGVVTTCSGGVTVTAPRAH
jgi:hypothetical protein